MWVVSTWTYGQKIARESNGKAEWKVMAAQSACFSGPRVALVAVCALQQHLTAQPTSPVLHWEPSVVA